MELKETTLLKLFVGCLWVLLVTGTVNLLAPIAPIFKQMLSLVHLLAGLVSSGIAIFYAYKHTRTTLGFRRLFSVVMGSATFIAFMISLVTGLMLVVTGVVEARQNIKNLHDYASYLCLALLIVHIAGHVLTFPERRLKSQGTKFMTLNSGVGKATVLASLLGVGAVGFIALVDDLVSRSPQASPVDNYSYNYGDGKFLPALATTTGDAFIATEAIANSLDCIACHQTIGEQWLTSAHRHAADDPTYVRNVMLLEGKKGIEATRYCEGCHSPVALLTGQLSEGGKHAGVKGTVAHTEGVGCMSCHGVDNIHSTQGNASYNFKPRQDYLFEYSTLQWLKSLNHLSIKLRPKAHVADLLPPVQHTANFCSSCHSQFMDKSMNDWGWVKMQDEYLAWSASKFNQSRDTRFSHPESRNCQSCHMPKMPGTGLAADENGMVSGHYFAAANVMLAKHFGHEDLFEETKKFLQQDKVSIYIVPPEDKLAQQSDLYVNPNTGVDNKHPVALYRGQEHELTVLVNNHGVGHNFPGGTIDLNEAWIAFKVIDANQKEVYSSGYLLSDGSVESSAIVYKESPLNSEGKPVWKHDLFNMVGRSYSNTVPAGATDVLNYRFEVPDWAVSPLNISATLKFRKLNAKYQRWVELEQPIKENPIIDIARDALSVPLLKTRGIKK